MQKPQTAEDILQKLETVDINSLSPEGMLVLMQLADQIVEASYLGMSEVMRLDEGTLEGLRHAPMDF